MRRNRDGTIHAHSLSIQHQTGSIPSALTLYEIAVMDAMHTLGTLKIDELLRDNPAAAEAVAPVITALLALREKLEAK